VVFGPTLSPFLVGIAYFREGPDDDTRCGVPEPASNLLEGRRRRFGARFLQSTAHFFLLPQNLLLALGNDGVA
jgi:hypothetical protein